MYNKIIMDLSKKNKYYRAKNEPLIQRFNELAYFTEQEEIRRGVPEEMRIESQKIWDRSERLMSCGTFIELNISRDNTAVKSGNFCHDKFCALCAKIRSVKRYGQMLNVLNTLRERGEIYNEVGNEVIVGMITVTQKNVPVEQLADEIQTLSKAVKRMVQSKLWKDCIKGYAKSLEITYNTRRHDFHPHYHFLVIWDKSKYKLHSSSIQQLWKRSLRINYVPQCQIQEAYGQNADLTNIINECLKYNIKAAKDNDIPLYADLSVTEFKQLIEALKHKRMVSYNGIIADIRQELRYPAEDNDKCTDVTIETNNIQLPEETNTILLQWSEKNSQYLEVVPGYEL